MKTEDILRYQEALGRSHSDIPVQHNFCRGVCYWARRPWRAISGVNHLTTPKLGSSKNNLEDRAGQKLLSNPLQTMTETQLQIK